MAKDSKTKADKPASNAGSSAAPSIRDEGAPAAVAGFTIKKALNLPTLKLEVGVPRAIVILSAMAVSTMKVKDEDNAPGKDGKKGRQPATVVEARDAVTGERGTLICASVIKSSLEENYEPEGYVGKTFIIQKHDKKPGKDYFGYSIDEVEAEG